MTEFVTNSYEETVEKAAQFAKTVKKGSVIGFIGGLGMGKTAFTTGFVKGLGIDAPVFVLKVDSLLSYFENLSVYSPSA